MSIKHLVLSILISAQCSALGAQTTPPQLSSQAYISLITCSPGRVLYEAFGHSAFRVYDPVNKIDVMFNYGTFDFSQPNFYSNYAKGRPVFTLSVSQTRYFLNAYVMDNRSVFQDILNLTPEQNQQLFDLLLENNEPENRDYLYDYIYDNCSTRLRDMIEKLLNGGVVFDTSNAQSYSFRGLMDLYAHEQQPWGDLGIDLALGSEIDAPATPYQYMFLPDFLQQGFQNAHIIHGDSSMPLVKNSITIFKAEPEETQDSLFSPLNVFWFVFFVFLGITVFDWRRGKVSIAADLLLFFIAGLVGILIAYISFFSDHHARGNFNLLWALPTHLLFAMLLPFKSLKFVRYYSLIAAILAVAALLGGLTVFPQELNYAFIPVVLTIGMRAALIYVKRR